MVPARPHVAVLGAGPIGLEAALAAAERGWPVTVYEASERVAGHVREWGHVRLFTPWDLLVSPRMAAAGVPVPAGDGPPTGHELAERVLEPVAALPAVAAALRLGTRVHAVSRQGLLKSDEIGTGRRAARPFRLLVEGPHGEERVERADVVLDCTGSYGTPNTLGDGGIPAPGETRHGDRIAYRIPDLERDGAAWAGRTVLLTGAGASAQTAARAFARHAPATRVVWAVRDAAPDWGAVPGDPLPERAALHASSAALAAGASDVVELRAGRAVEGLAGRDGRLSVTLRGPDGAEQEVVVDRVLALNGSVGDHSLYRQLQVHECYATAGPMALAASLLAAGGGGDCLAQVGAGPEVLRTPEPGFFILGAKSYGRNSQFLLRLGWEQVDDVLGLLDAERTAAPAAA